MSHHRHTKYHLHITRVILASLAVVAVAILRLPSLSPVVEQPRANTTQTQAVLAYATSINVTDLANGTNSARSQNGLANLSLNSKLNVSAQLKANDMIAKDYWAHVSPDGTQPWYWFQQAGYDYTNAGENLAYGFGTSDSVINAWMNSAGHRANILGDYKDMGFGIANGENYQGAQNTVVVAHYGTARTVAATPPPAPAQTTPTSSTPPQAPTAPTTTSPSSSETTPATTPTTTDTTKQQNTPSPAPVANTTPSTSTKTTTSVSTPSQVANLPLWRQLLSGSAPALALISMSILLVVGVGYITTHIKLVKHAAVIGEQYVLHHPLIDATVAIGASIIVLVTTIGHIG